MSTTTKQKQPCTRCDGTSYVWGGHVLTPQHQPCPECAEGPIPVWRDGLGEPSGVQPSEKWRVR